MSSTSSRETHLTLLLEKLSLDEATSPACSKAAAAWAQSGRALLQQIWQQDFGNIPKSQVSLALLGLSQAGGANDRDRQGAFDERFNVIISEHFRDNPWRTMESLAVSL